MGKIWLTSLIENIRGLPDGKYETINQVRELIGGLSIEDFEAILETLATSNRGSLTFSDAIGTEVELSKITEGKLDVDVRFDVPGGNVTIHYSFAIGDCHNKISGENHN